MFPLCQTNVGGVVTSVLAEGGVSPAERWQGPVNLLSPTQEIGKTWTVYQHTNWQRGATEQ